MSKSIRAQNPFAAALLSDATPSLEGITATASYSTDGAANLLLGFDEASIAVRPQLSARSPSAAFTSTAALS
jgi:hypothetical protein